MDPATLAFALVAGAVAAFNPCGFALLPAYLGLLVADPGRGSTWKALRFSAGMTVGFVAVFGLAAGVLAPLALALARYLPVVTVAMGIVLVGAGIRLLAGHHLGVRGLAGRGSAPGTRWWSQAGYGVSFALASLSCTIAPFLAVTAGALRTGGALGVAASFLAYALGMGTVVLVLALAVAAARTSVVGAMRRAGAALATASGALLVVAGAYVGWYGWYEIATLAGSTSTDPVIAAATQVQSSVSRAVAGLGPGGLLVLAAAAALVTALLLRRSRRVRGPGTRA